MKLRTALLLSSFFLPVCASAYAADTYNIDGSHTNVEWSIDHFGFSKPNGKFSAQEGQLVLDTAKPENSTVNVTFRIDSLVTGVAKLDEHLKSKDFFDAAQFPTASFASTKVEVTGKDTALVHGNLTLHGVTKPVTLNVHLNKMAPNMMKKQTAGFSAAATIKRSDFGISAYLPDLGNDIALNIQAEANQP